MRPFTEWGRRLFTTHVALAVFVLSLAFLSSENLFAQANAGVTGTVTDSSGAVVVGATVTITNQGTSVATHTTTSSSGTYAVTGLAPGVYSVAVEATE